MQNYRVLCYGPACSREASYKIAARWSDGLTHELKTYSLCCEECLTHEYAGSLRRYLEIHQRVQENSEPPGIYHREPRHRDRELQRLIEKEQAILAAILK